MKILFTGGGSGGHFYPLIAVAEEIQTIAREKKLLPPALYYVAPTPFDEQALFENGIQFRQSPAGKVRRYFSLLNIVDVLKTAIGIIKSLFQVFFIYPDVIFSKGGYPSFPTVLAARLFRIPLIIHESDSSPGRVNRWAGKFAERIALSYADAAEFFPKEKTALVGNPIRRALKTVAREGAPEFLKLSPNIPVVFVLGGSLGAQALNDTILGALPEILSRYQVIHQTGDRNFTEVEQTSKIVLERNQEFRDRYKVFPFLNDLAMRMSAGIASIIVTRSGSGAIFEIAQWGIPAIIIPLPESVSHDQTKNAFTYARSGAAMVIEQANLTPHLLVSEIDRLMGDPELRIKMSAAAKTFARPDAARAIADEVLSIALKHEHA